MFGNQYIQEIDYDLQFYAGTIETLVYLQRKEQQLIQIKERLDELIYDAQDDQIAVDNVRTMATRTLKNYALQAIRRTKEFNQPLWINRLMSAIDDPRTINIRYDSSTKNIKITIDLDRTAGTLDDYAQAVTRAREDLHIGPGRGVPMSPEMASYMWKEKYYGPAREGKEIPQPKRKERTSKRKERSDKKDRREYDTEKYIQAYARTMRLRASYFQKPAPFWMLINYGTTPLASDWGGTEYPNIPPQNFVERALKDMRKTYTYTLDDQNERIKELRERKIPLEKALRYIRYYIKKVELEVEKIEKRRGSRHLSSETRSAGTKEFTLQQVKQALGERFGYADSTKILDIVNAMSQGEEVPERVSLSKAGSGRSVRMRTKQLYKIVLEYRNSL